MHKNRKELLCALIGKKIGQIEFCDSVLIISDSPQKLNYAQIKDVGDDVFLVDFYVKLSGHFKYSRSLYFSIAHLGSISASLLQ